MTIHSLVEYHCSNCGRPYVPMPITPNCPNCGTAAEKLFNDFINQTIASARYNVMRYHSFLPGVWGIFNVGDHYYYLAFGFYDFAQKKSKLKVEDLLARKIPYEKAEIAAAKFMERLDLSKQPYMAPVFKAYFITLISSGASTGNQE